MSKKDEALRAAVEALAPILERVREMDDAGPYGEGWQSYELRAEISAADSALSLLRSALEEWEEPDKIAAGVAIPPGGQSNG